MFKLKLKFLKPNVINLLYIQDNFIYLNFKNIKSILLFHFISCLAFGHLM